LKKLSSAFAVLAVSSHTALAHPSMHHTGNESLLHDVNFVLFGIAALVIVTAIVRMVLAKR
jgi:ABC-type proline/glycine betaine transport system substrate-binding protein